MVDEAQDRTARSALTARRLPLVALGLMLMLALSAVAALGCGSDSPREIKRADISNLPTPSGGEIFAAEGDVQPTAASTGDGDGDADGLQSQSGFGGGGGGPFGGGGFGDFQRVIEENPEVASLIEKARAGTSTEADAARLEQLLIELFQPGGEFGGAFAQPSITFGVITHFDGMTVTLAPDVTSAPADAEVVAMTDDAVSATVGDNTAMLHAEDASLADVMDGTNIDIIAVRSEQGVIIANTVTVLQATGGSGAGAGPGAGAGLFGGALGSEVGASAFLTGDGEEIPIQGRVTNIIEGRIHVEAGQGPLRVTVTDDTRYYRIGVLEPADVQPDTTALLVAIGDGNAAMLFVGPAELLAPVAERGFGAPGREGLQGPGGFGQPRNGDEGLEGTDGQQQPGPGGAGRRPGGGLRRFAR